MWIFPIIKCVDTACNLRCDYCFYRYIDQGIKPTSMMSDDILEKIVIELLNLNQDKCTFLWHGGEPLLSGINFFKKVIKFQRKHGHRNVVIKNNIQTNGTLINEEFVKFFKKNNFKVGISLDGPEHIHDYYRKDARGYGSFDKIVKNIRLCQKEGISISVVAAVTDYSVKFPDEIYNFFLSFGIKRFALNPVFELNKEGSICNFSVKDKNFAKFLEKIFNLWIRDDDPEINIRQLTEPFLGILGGKSSACIYSGECSRFLDIYPNGDVKQCHSFIGESACLGNILEKSFSEIIDGNSYHKFSQRVQIFSQECLECRWFSICHGGCADYRNLKGTKEDSKYIYCGSRKRIFGLLEKRFAELK